MAKRSTKVKKPSEEQPALHMIIEKGRLIPAFPLDYERLDSYRNGTKMLVWMATDGDRPLVRRWWATIGNYIKHTDLPWGDRETASAAIKLALAMVNPFKMPSGDWSQYPRSLNDLDDAELEGKIREMEQLLLDLTGVDVEALRKGGNSFGDEPFETNQPANDAGDETLSGDPIPPPAASEEGTGATTDPSPVLSDGTGATDSEADPAAAADVAGNDLREPVAAEQGQIIREGDAPREDDCQAGEASQGGRDASGPDTDSPGDAGGPAPDDGGGADSPAAPPPAELSAEDRVWLKQGAKMMLATLPAPDPESYRVLIAQLKSIKSIMPRDISDAALSRMETIRLHCTAVCKGEVKIDKALVASTALARLDEVEPEPVKVRDE